MTSIDKYLQFRFPVHIFAHMDENVSKYIFMPELFSLVEKTSLSMLHWSNFIAKNDVANDSESTQKSKITS